MKSSSTCLVSDTVPHYCLWDSPEDAGWILSADQGCCLFSAHIYSHKTLLESTATGDSVDFLSYILNTMGSCLLGMWQYQRVVSSWFLKKAECQGPGVESLHSVFSLCRCICPGSGTFSKHTAHLQSWGWALAFSFSTVIVRVHVGSAWWTSHLVETGPSCCCRSAVLPHCPIPGDRAHSRILWADLRTRERASVSNEASQELHWSPGVQKNIIKHGWRLTRPGLRGRKRQQGQTLSVKVFRAAPRGRSAVFFRETSANWVYIF